MKGRKEAICSKCGKLKGIIKTFKETNKMYCNNCYSYIRKEICNNCNKLGRVAKRNDDKSSICFNCYAKLNREICSGCNKLKPVHTRNENNLPLCNNCYAPLNTKICSICNKNKQVALNHNGQPVCHSCYAIKFHMAKCSICGENKIIHTRIEEKPVCGKCHKINKMENCYICNKETIVYGRDEYHNPLCDTCYRKQHKEICYMCGSLSIVHTRNEDNFSICIKCYENKKICTWCGKLKQATKKINNGVLCSRCNHKYRMQNDPKYNLMSTLRGHVKRAFKQYSKHGKVKPSKKYGIDFNAIFEHMGPCPGDRKDYHIDHILPLSAFNFDNPTHVKAAFAPENHQWLKAKDNMIKSDKYNQEDFDNYIKKFEDEND